MPVRLVCGRLPDRNGNVELGTLALRDSVAAEDLAPEVMGSVHAIVAEAVERLDAAKADRATTLAGYGIADAYTAAQVDGRIVAAVSAVRDSAPDAFDTLKEISDWIAADETGTAALVARVASLETGKQDALAAQQLADIAAVPQKADKSEVDAKTTLTPVYSDTPTFSGGWTFSPPADITIEYSGDPSVGWIASADGWEDYIQVAAPEDATELSFTGWDDIYYTATRTRTDIVGYTLGDQTTRPLQPKGDYAIRSELPSVPVQSVNGKIGAVVLTGSDISWKTGTNLSVAASLELADQTVAALQTGKADASALRYDKIDLGIASPMVQTDYTDPDNPIDYVTLPLTDRAVAGFTIDTTIAELRLTFPDAVAGKIRDFGLFIYIQDTIPAPALVPPSGVRFFTNDGKMPTLASHDDTHAYTLMYFSEQPYGNIFLAKAEEVKEVS